MQEERSMQYRTTLRSYWHETISREEGVRRLASRPITADARSRLERVIPEKTEHFLSFEGGSFREYADFGNGIVNLLLLLPVAEERNAAVLVAPTEDMKGFALHRFQNRKGRLYVDGIPREGFNYSTKPMKLNVTFSLPVDRSADEPEVEEISEFCCRACDFVHSTLGIHDLDFICCIFICIDVLGDASGGEPGGGVGSLPGGGDIVDGGVSGGSGGEPGGGVGGGGGRPNGDDKNGDGDEKVKKTQ